ncbi:uncharacterized protein LOC135831740 [Planococcus citri]|uniref:uncharacterized protein LOC135831740 n=1 Tax=Planococcus citri TaxID=170843 RepID=UPI0031F79637
MNIGSVGTPASGAVSGRFSHAASSHVAASQRLLQLNHGYDVSASPGTPLGIRDKNRLIPSRKREEKAAVQNLQRRIELGKILHSSVNEDFMRVVYGRKMTLENVPPFLKKITSNRSINYVHDEDCQEDIHDNEFIQEALLWHNIYRRHHNSPPLKISAQLCGKAQAWANHLAHTNTFLYENDKSVGQNIYCRLTSDAQIEVPAQEIVSFWYSCYKNYTYNKEPDTLHININAGNFTQLVWRSTRYFGIGRARSRAGKFLVVANYQPVGNIGGLFKENVLPPTLNKEFM